MSRRVHDVAAIAALAFLLACGAHELLGHAAACLAAGSRITLLTSVYFRCEAASAAIDIAGPLANFLVAAAAYLLLVVRAWPPRVRLFLVLSMAFNVFWFAGCMLESAAANTSDFAFALQALAIHPPWLGRAALGILGVLVYWRGLHLAWKYAAAGTPFIAAYVAAGAASLVAVLCFWPITPAAMRAAALESFGAMIGLLLLAHRSRRAPTL